LYLEKNQLTKKNLVNIVVIHILVNQQPLVFTKAATFQIHKVSMFHSSDQDNFVQKFVYTLCILHKQLLHSDRTVIRKYTLQQANMSCHYNIILLKVHSRIIETS
jgi:hypothetical protein